MICVKGAYKLMIEQITIFFSIGTLSEELLSLFLFDFLI